MLHTTQCPMAAGNHTDEANRVSHTYRLHRLADPIGSIGHWFACRMSDGTSDNVLYDSKRDAVIHQHHNEQWYMFIQIGPHDMTVCEAEAFVAIKRKLDNAGISLTDPDHRNGGMDVIPRLSREDNLSQLRSIFSGGRTRPSNLHIPRG